MRSLSWSTLATIAACAALIVVNYTWIELWVAKDPWPGDGAVYLAAGERLNAGHDLYELVPGDRLVPYVPPYYAVPLLYPPLIAVIWRPLAALPDVIGLSVWWVLDMIAAGVLGVVALRGKLLPAAAILTVLGPPLIISATLGNIDPFLILGGWWTWRQFAVGREAAGSFLTVAMTLIKPTVAPLMLWQLMSGRSARTKVGAAIAVLVPLSLITGGVENHIAYLNVMSATLLTGSTEDSIAGIARRVGVPHAIASIVPIAAAAAMLAGMWLVRKRPERSYRLAAVACLLGSPAVHFHSAAILLIALAPSIWLTPGGSVKGPRDPYRATSPPQAADSPSSA